MSNPPANWNKEYIPPAVNPPLFLSGNAVDASEEVVDHHRADRHGLQLCALHSQTSSPVG